MEAHRSDLMIVMQPMKKKMLAVLPALALSLAAPMAHADNGTEQFTEGGIQAANNHSHDGFSGPVAETGGHQSAVVPVGGHWIGEHQNNGSNANLLNHIGH